VVRLLVIMISIGLADSLNPTTIAPALYLASGERARGRVAEFTLAVFLVYLVGGLAIALGPGALVLSLIPHPHHRVAYVIELVAGAALLAAATLVWRHRARLSDRDPPDFDPQGRSSWILGATITAIELPTAFPYFAAIAAVVGADVDPPREILLIVVFNVCFILPLIGIVATLTFAGDHAERVLCRWRDFLQAHWPRMLAAVGVMAGLFVMALGITGLTSSSHTDFGQFMHRVRHHLLHPLK
jgi:cytochrome c biogenesis protein CcdA